MPLAQTGYDFTSRHIDLGGVRMHTVDAGSGVPVLMLHGNPTWSYFYRGLIGALRDRHRCIAPDHIGCGLSAKPADYPYRLARHIDNCAQLLDALAIDRCHLVAHDWGGAIGCGLAARDPARILSINLLNTAAFPHPRLPRRIALCRLPLLGALLVRGLNGFARAATRMTTLRPLPAAVRRAYLLPYDSWAARVAIQRFVEDIPMAPGHPSWPTLAGIAAALPGLTAIPRRLHWASHDWCFDTTVLARWRAIWPDAEVTMYPAGHYILEDAGPAVAANLARQLI
jgi:haloalkane dehalogenase